MKYGAICYWSNDLEVFKNRVRLAEDLGYSCVGIGDGQSIARELYVSLAVAAQQTSRTMIGPMVTNPVTRHPAIAASAIASIDHLSGGRAVFGFGAGGSTLMNVSEPMGTQAAMREYILTMKALLRGESTTWRGKKMHTKWVERPVPIWLAAYGEKSLRLAGEIADGVIIASSAKPEILRDCLDVVSQGAASAGRKLEDLDVWLMVRASVRDTHAEAITDMKANLASGAKHAFRSPMHRKSLSPEIAAKVDELYRRYAPHEHVQWSGSNAALLDELGLTELLADRIAIAGTPDECRDRVRQISKLGVDGILLPVVDRDPENVLRRFASEVFSQAG